MKKKIILILILFLILLTNVKAVDTKIKIYDYNQTITLNQENELRKKVNDFISENNIDMVLITIKHYETKTVEEYVKKFYKKNKFGVDEDKSTIIYVLDYTDDPILEIYTSGKASDIYNKRVLEEIKESVNFNDSSYKIFDKLIDKSRKYTNNYMDVSKYIVFNKISKNDYKIIAIISFLISTSIMIILILKSRKRKLPKAKEEKINLRMIKTVDKFLSTHTEAYRFGNKKGFTLIELLAVIVILAIISLIAVPIVINIISDSKYESQKRSIDLYAEALKQSVADYQLKNNKKVEGKFNTTDGKILTREDTTLNVNYKGNVVCNRIVVNKDGSIYLSECTVDGDKIYISQEESKKENSTKYYEYGKTEYGMIMENKSHSYKFLNTGISSSVISQFEIHTDGINVPDGYESIDCSYNQDKSVMCYWRNWEHLNRANEYEMHIASDGEIYTPYDSSYLFYYLGSGYYNSLRALDFTGLNTSKTTDMSYMFNGGGTNLREFSFGNTFDTSNVTNMEGMFKYFAEGYGSKFILPNSFDTSNVTNMSYMFYSSFYYGLGIDLGNNFDTSNVTNMSYMFDELCRRNMKNLELGDKFDTSNVTNMSYMFASAGENSLTSLRLGDKFDTSNVTNMSYMFARLTFLKELNLGDKFNTSSVTNMSYMFAYMKNLKSLDFLNQLDTSNVTDMSYMFAGVDSEYMPVLDFSNKLNTSKVTNMSGMFEATGWNHMTKLNLGDTFNTSNVTNMNYMFRETGHENMEELNLGNNFDTSKVTGMYWMFVKTGYKKLKKLDLGSKFVKGYDTNASNMFEEAGHDSMTELNFRNFDITYGSWINKHNALKNCGSDGVLTKVVVKDQQTKQRIINGIISTGMSPNVTTPQFWQDNDIIQVQAP